MSLVSVYFSLGTNLGDRKGNMAQALKLMDEAFGVHYEALSSMIETEAMGFSGGKFLNAAVLYRMARPNISAEEACLEVLRKVKAIERSMGRTDPPEYDSEGNRVYHSRVIDIDIIFYGSERISLPELVVPHKGIENRPFVMIPLSEIAEPFIKKSFPEYFG